MKYCLNKPSQSLYHFSKVTGLVPFRFDFVKRRAFESITSVFYSIAFTLIISSYLAHYIYVLSFLITALDEDLLIVLILLVDLVSALLKAVSFYIQLLVQRRAIIESINSFMIICELIFEPECNHKQRFKSFFNKKLTNACRTKCTSVCIQVIMLIIAFSIYDLNVSLYYTINNAILISYTRILTTIATSVLYCGGMLFTARLYRCLNKQIKGLSKSIDGLYNENHDAQYSIDQISFLYERITALTSKICRIYAFQITISFIGIIAWLLGSVRSVEFPVSFRIVTRMFLIVFPGVLYVLLCRKIDKNERKSIQKKYCQRYCIHHISFTRNSQHLFTNKLSGESSKIEMVYLFVQLHLNEWFIF